MHDQSASRISGRTRAAVSAICVRALRITVLKSAGNFTRDECHDLNAEKIQRVKRFMFTRCGICSVRVIFEHQRRQLGSKISRQRATRTDPVLSERDRPKARGCKSSGDRTRTHKSERADWLRSMSAMPLIAARKPTSRKVRVGPCVDGSRLARRISLCSNGRSSHVFGLFARYS